MCIRDSHICLKAFAQTTLNQHIEIFHEKPRINSFKNVDMNEGDHKNKLKSSQNKYASEESTIKMKMFHEKLAYSCKTCRTKFTITRSLMRHVRGSAAESSFHCDECEKSLSALKMHIKCQQEKSSKDIQPCTQCLELIYVQVHLKQHILPSACERCSKCIIKNLQVWAALNQNKMFQVF